MKKQIQEIFASLGNFIREHGFEDTPMLTAYVDVDTTDQDNRRDRPAWLIELKNEAKRIEDEYGTDEMKRRETKNKWADTEELILNHLQDSAPKGRSVVIFTDHQDFLTLDLPVPIATRLFYGQPQLKPLMFALDRYKKILVVLISEEEVKMLDVFLSAPAESASSAMGTPGGFSLRPGSRTARTQASERRDLATERKFVSDAAAEINAYFTGDSEFEHIVFGGNLKLAHAIKKAMHPAVYADLVTIEPIAFSSSDTEIVDAVKRIAEEKEQDRDLALVNELVARRHACGTAVLEAQGVLTALEQGQASKVVISVPIDSDKFDQLLVKSLLSNCDIEFVHAEAAKKLNEYGGIAAILYYSGR